jgi:hypothetical protein
MRKFLLIKFFLTTILLYSCGNTLVRLSNVANKKNEHVKKDKNNLLPISFKEITYKKYVKEKYEDIEIQLLNDSNFNQLIKGAKNKYKYFVFYTSGCQGTGYELNYIRKSDSTLNERVNFYLISSDNIAPYLVQILQKKLFNNQFCYPTYIIDNNIKSFIDDRKRSLIFRNKICKECKDDIIGVPYIILFDKNNNVIFHGYRGYKNKYPSDILTYFIK